MTRASRNCSCLLFTLVSMTACSGSDEQEVDADDAGDTTSTADGDTSGDTRDSDQPDVQPDAGESDGSSDTGDLRETDEGSDTTDDAPDADASVDAPDATGELPDQFIESFDNEDWWDPASTAVLDIELGRLVSPARWTLDDDVGDGSDGNLEVTGVQSIGAGNWQYNNVSLNGGTLTIDGDVTIRVTGDFTAGSGARLDVVGSLTLVVDGAINIGCAILASTGDLSIHQPSDAGIIQDCAVRVNGIQEATFHTERNLPGPHGSVTVSTRGTIDMRNRGYFFSGANPVNGSGGSVFVRAYGDILLENDSYIIGGNRGTTNLATEVWSEGRVALSTDSYIISNSTGPDAVVRVRSGGGVSLLAASYIINNGGGLTEVLTEGPLSILDNSFITSQGATDNGNQTVIAARSLLMRDGSIEVSAGGADTHGGGLRIDAVESVVCEGYCEFTAGGEDCEESGDLTIQTNGPITLAETYIGLDPPGFGEICPAHTPGRIALRSGGTRTATILNFVSDIEPIVESELGALGLEVSGFVVSSLRGQSLPIDTIFSSEVVNAFEADSEGMITATAIPPGGDIIDTTMLVGSELPPGWRYSIEAHGRFFDAAWVDELRVSF